MKKLFILGNGFDLEHNLPTKYLDFKNYLVDTNRYIEPSISITSTELPNGGREYDMDEVTSLLIESISNTAGSDLEWGGFECYLGKLDFSKYFDDISYLFENDDNLFHEAYAQEDFGQVLLDSIPQIKELFTEWIGTINIDNTKIKRNLVELVNFETDKFINFNYTRVLESIYGISERNIWHPHGCLGEKIIVGHGNNEFEDSERYIGATTFLNSINKELQKDTHSIANNNDYRFKNLSKQLEIYSYGFSFSDVDLPYIKKLCASIDTEKSIWYLSSYDSVKTKEKYKELIYSCGFKGKFSGFEI